MRTEVAVAPDCAKQADVRVRVPSVLRCGATIAFLKLILRLRGFGGAIGWITRRVQNLTESARVDVAVVRQVENAVAMAGALYPGRALCLEQSLTLYFLLRRQGVPVKYCQGVQPYPFEAHAWIEYNGEVISDVREHAQLFARLPDQLP